MKKEGTKVTYIPLQVGFPDENGSYEWITLAASERRVSAE